MCPDPNLPIVAAAQKALKGREMTQCIEHPAAQKCSTDNICTYLDAASKIVETAAFELAEDQPPAMIERLLQLAVEIESAREAIA